MAEKLKLIDQYAVRLLESDPNAYSEEWNADYERGFLDAINKALEIPTIEVEPDNGWISVDDRPPDDDVDVLLHDKYCGTLIGWYDKKDDVFKTDYISQLEAVTRWMPLPEEPKEE